MLFLESEDPDLEISLYINSPGGLVNSGLAIYDTMQLIRSPISTICVGQAASIAALLLAGGAGAPAGSRADPFLPLQRGKQLQRPSRNPITPFPYMIT